MGKPTCQVGKTTRIADIFTKQALDKSCVPLYLAFNYKFILKDAKIKFEKLDRDIKILDPNTNTIINNQRVGVKRLGEILASTGTLVADRDEDYRNTGLVGLSNHHTLEKYNYPLSMLHNTSTKTPLYLDEYDPFEVGFKVFNINVSKRTGIKGAAAVNRSLAQYIKLGLFSEINLISATNLGGVISTTNYDNIEAVQPGKGYTNNVQYFRLEQEDINKLKNGIETPRVKEFRTMLDHNLMVNINQRIETHTNIQNAFKRVEATVHVVNMRTEFDFRVLYNGKHIIIGGRMFGRGASFYGLQGLILDKPGSDLTTLIQAAGRIFGYKDYPIYIACTRQQEETLKAAFEYEAQISDVSILKLPYQERREIVRKIIVPIRNMKILTKKNNGWKHWNTKLGTGIVYPFNAYA
jgi:hypothetical protein